MNPTLLPTKNFISRISTQYFLFSHLNTGNIASFRLGKTNIQNQNFFLRKAFAEKRTRTSTKLPSLAPEASASTNSAIPAYNKEG